MQQSLDAKFVKQPYNIASKHLYDKVHYKMMGLEMINKRTRNVAICYFLILLIAVITFAAFYPGDQYSNGKSICQRGAGQHENGSKRRAPAPLTNFPRTATMKASPRPERRFGTQTTTQEGGPFCYAGNSWAYGN